MSIVTKISAIVATMTTGSVIGPPAVPVAYQFHHCEPEELNLEDDDIQFPFVFLEFPLNGEDDIPEMGGGSVYTTYACRIFFAHKSKLPDDQAGRQPRIDLMRKAKNEFLRLLYEDDTIEIIGKPTNSEVINDFDFNADGIYLNLKLRIDEEVEC
jgi:hypothetical protein